MRRFVLAAFAATSLLVPQIALAWGNTGHEIVGRLAQSALDSTVRTRALRMLDSDPKCPASPAHRNFAQVAVLPDEFRNPEGGEVTREWHFVNIDIDDIAYDEARDCPSGDCVNRRIEHLAEVLADRTRSKCERKDALIYLIHFVGDVHQPFHCGFGHLPDGTPDRGGNGVIVRIGNHGQDTNLHSVWDTTFIDLARTENQWVKHLRNDVIPSVEASDVEAPVTEWVKESHDVTRDMHVATGTTLDDDYVDKATDIIEKRLALAALRLARLIDEALR